MTDRTIDSVTALSKISFDDSGLVPVVAQGVDRGDVLMLAWANREALEKSLVTGHLHFWSRSRRALWRKGETSGNTLEVISLHADCDGDTVLARVQPAGPACHTGDATCFGEIGGHGRSGGEPGGGADDRVAPVASGADERRAEGEPVRAGGVTGPGDSHHPGPLERLDATLRSRVDERPEGSYTVRLLDDANLRMKKIGEESAELVAALATHDGGRAVEEAADLVYHAVVALRAEGFGVDALLAALERRAE
jgi:phosphoribosyl-ATP pyrophosphohydrolase/phosphoribosyl-AMP cyclohydrolase